MCMYSSTNRADAPSRDREVELPTKAVPFWMQQLLEGDYRAFDLVCQSAGYPKLLGDGSVCCSSLLETLKGILGLVEPVNPEEI